MPQHKLHHVTIKQNQTVIMPHIQGPLILSNPLPNMNKLPHPRAKLRSGQVTNRISVCEVGTVNNISEGQLEGFGFNIPPGQGLDFRRRSFAIPSVDKDVKPLL